ncbi:DUF5777 family beta-barrel protein [Mucilaginibacter sp. BT774]|uniref:DUF5777 family beta-barrel protein n=1 Tax=Mucilaginibacter sp. BT774 TaxID=3062276 RepID=UPI002674518F|nr:DUF5777 family beta-barrel protein [Mucilaginibacter sp. BT774]
MAQKTSTTDSLFNSMNNDGSKGPITVFESPRFILTQSTETIKKNNLNVLVIHRFGDAAGNLGGGKTFFGLDAVADVYIGFEYGLTNDLNIDIGRSTIPTVGGLVSAQLKYAVLHQTSDGSSPLAISVLGQTGVRPYNTYSSFSDRMSYFAQAIFARKFSHSFAFQVAPSILYDNLPNPNVPGNENTIFSLSATARLKVTKLMSVVVDYAHPFSSFRNNNAGFSDPLGLGIQVVTGGHVFTLNVTNSRAVSEMNYLSNTASDFGRGQYRLGFTISRMFDFNHKEKYNPK